MQLSKIILILSLSLVFINKNQAQDFLFARKYGSSDYEEIKQMALDSKGYIYVTGIFKGSSSFGKKSIIGSGDNDIFISKLSPTGKVIWVKQAGGPGYDIVGDIKLDHKGYLYITGSYSATASFGSKTLISKGSTDIFLAKYDTSGNIIWLKSGGGPKQDIARSLCLDKEKTSVYIAGSFESSVSFGPFNASTPNDPYPYIAKYDQSGQELLLKAFPARGAYLSQSINDIESDKDGNLFFTGEFNGAVNFDSYTAGTTSGTQGTFVVKADPQVRIKWAKSSCCSAGNAIALDQNSNIFITGILEDYSVLGGISLYGKNGDGYMIKLDSTGKGQWGRSFVANNGTDYGLDVATDKSGNSYFSCYQYNATEYASGEGTYVVKFDKNGNYHWTSRPGQGWSNTNSFGNAIKTDNNGNIYLAGKFSCDAKCGGKFTFGNITLVSSGNLDAFLTVISDTMFIRNKNMVKGQVYKDLNADCKKSIPDPGYPYAVVVAEPGPYYAVTNLHGYYTLHLDTGTYTIRQIISEEESGQVKQSCPQTSQIHTVQFDTSGIIVLKKDFADSAKMCARLKVNIASGKRKPCSTGETVVRISNTGATVAKDIRVEVEYPANIIPKVSNPWVPGLGQLNSFDIYSIAPGGYKDIKITDSVKCIQSLSNSTQCIRAKIIYPSNECRNINSEWDRSNLIVKGRCENGSAIFSILNNWSGNMKDSTEYRVFFNELLSYKNKVKLMAGDSLIVKIPSAVETIRLEADQSKFHPYTKYRAFVLESCLGSESVDRGKVNIYPMENLEDESDILCLEINDFPAPITKECVPTGIGEEHFIPTQATNITYKISFQNTAIDTASFVIINDSLSQYLDISTMEGIISSHPVKYEISGKEKPLIIWKIFQLNLPDSKTNWSKSNGFVQYSIRTKNNLPEGTKIKNRAAVYFDFNKPINSNEVYHTIKNIFPTDFDKGQDILPIHFTYAVNPDTASSELKFTNLTETSVTASWKPGNGSGRIVLVKEIDYTFFPTDGRNYSANSDYKNALEQIYYSKVVYNGTENSVTVTNLNPNTKYYFEIYEYNADYNTVINYADQTTKGSVITPVTTGINKANDVQKISTYPNPFTNNILISIPENKEIYALKLVNVQGQVMSRTEDISEKIHSIDVSQLPEGSYSIILETERGIMYSDLLIKTNK